MTTSREDLPSARCHDRREWQLAEFSLILNLTDPPTVQVSPITQGVPAPHTAVGPLLTLQLEDGSRKLPVRMTWQEAFAHLVLHYGSDGSSAEIAVDRQDTHVRFELKVLRTDWPVELVIWGPFASDLNETIGETVGVVRDAQFAVGLQALNPKTIAGYPHPDDVMPPCPVFAENDYADVTDAMRHGDIRRGEAAVATETGSVLQAYCRNRDKPRAIRNLGYEHYVAPAFDDGGVIGSRIALFACLAARALQTIGDIEKAEGLPHPLMNGQWAKTSPRSTDSYFIEDFGETSLDAALERACASGMNYLYHSSPFCSWGHFDLKPAMFPNGWNGFRHCVEQAARRGIKIGVHTLTNFITPNDAYVTPVPDPRLARVGATALRDKVDALQDEIPIADPAVFQYRTTLDTAAIGNELVNFEGVSASAPWRLLGCKRGAFGTLADTHAAGSEVGRLADHPYRVFLTDAGLGCEVARRLAGFCNFTGVRMIDFDGLEGMRSTGLGEYGQALFVQTFWDALEPDLRDGFISAASNPGHWTWHIHTRFNWGEPWYAGFRDSQAAYRLKNQDYFRRNFLPPMLGWFALRAETNADDIAWLLELADTHRAGFALVDSLQHNADQVLPTAANMVPASAVTDIETVLPMIRGWAENRRQKQA